MILKNVLRQMIKDTLKGEKPEYTTIEEEFEGVTDVAKFKFYIASDNSLNVVIYNDVYHKAVVYCSKYLINLCDETTALDHLMLSDKLVKRIFTHLSVILKRSFVFKNADEVFTDVITEGIYIKLNTVL